MHIKESKSDYYNVIESKSYFYIKMMLVLESKSYFYIKVMLVLESKSYFLH